jgi:hypothetical protein
MTVKRNKGVVDYSLMGIGGWLALITILIWWSAIIGFFSIVALIQSWQLQSNPWTLIPQLVSGIGWLVFYAYVLYMLHKTRAGTARLCKILFSMALVMNVAMLLMDTKMTSIVLYQIMWTVSWTAAALAYFHMSDRVKMTLPDAPMNLRDYLIIIIAVVLPNMAYLIYQIIIHN